MTSYFDEHNCDPLPDNQAGSGKNFQLKKMCCGSGSAWTRFMKWIPAAKKPAKILGI